MRSERAREKSFQEEREHFNHHDFMGADAAFCCVEGEVSVARVGYKSLYGTPAMRLLHEIIKVLVTVG